MMSSECLVSRGIPAWKKHFFTRKIAPLGRIYRGQAELVAFRLIQAKAAEKRRLLVLPHPSGTRITHGQFQRHRDFRWNQRLQLIQPHDILDWNVQDQFEKIELAELVKPLEEFAEEFGQIHSGDYRSPHLKHFIELQRRRRFRLARCDFSRVYGNDPRSF
jgi:hypothetical protein